MDAEPEVIRHNMEETRASLADKLETLENQVVETVQGATSAMADTVDSVKLAVQDTVDSVKETVEDTVHSVRNTFDLERQMHRHPWAVLGGSMAVGYIVGHLVSNRRHHWSDDGYYPGSRMTRAVETGLSGLAESPPASQAPVAKAGAGATALAESASWLADVAKPFEPELQKLKGLAIGSLMGLVRNVVIDAMPPGLKPQVGEVLDSFTTKLGGQPVRDLHCNTNS